MRLHRLNCISTRLPGGRLLHGDATQPGLCTSHCLLVDTGDDERNNLLKEYQSRVHPLDSVPILLQAVANPTGGGTPQVLSAIMELDENVYRPMVDGPWAGDDAREVYEETIQWWERQLARIDALAAAHRKSAQRV